MSPAKANQDDKYSFLGPEKVTLTVPNEDERHMISSDQLERFCAGASNPALEYCLALLGAGAGLLQNIIKTAVDIFYNKQLPDRLDAAWRQLEWCFFLLVLRNLWSTETQAITSPTLGKNTRRKKN